MKHAVTQLPSLSCLFPAFTFPHFDPYGFWILRSRPRKIPLEDANRPELLVPIRLELDIEHHKLRDTFVWNLNGKFLVCSCGDFPLALPSASLPRLVGTYAHKPQIL